MYLDNWSLVLSGIKSISLFLQKVYNFSYKTVIKERKISRKITINSLIFQPKIHTKKPTNNKNKKLTQTSARLLMELMTQEN